jgi:hypothetical protein
VGDVLLWFKYQVLLGTAISTTKHPPPSQVGSERGNDIIINQIVNPWTRETLQFIVIGAHSSSDVAIVYEEEVFN